MAEPKNTGQSAETSVTDVNWAVLKKMIEMSVRQLASRCF